MIVGLVNDTRSDEAYTDRWSLAARKPRQFFAQRLFAEDMERTCNDSEGHDDEDEKEVAFLRARIVEAAREGDTPEIKYLVGISAAKRLLAARDEVTAASWSSTLR